VPATVRILPTLDGQLHLNVVVEGRPHGSMNSFVRKVEVQNDSAEAAKSFHIGMGDYYRYADL